MIKLVLEIASAILLLGGVIAMLYKGFTFVNNSVKRWRHCKIDAQINRELQHGKWSQPRVIIAGFPLVWTEELAERLSLDRQVVADRLKALKEQSKVWEEEGCHENPGTRWCFEP